MATILDDEDTIEAQALSTSLDPYGQLVKMLVPRALCIAIYDRMSMPLWLSDGCDGPDLLQLVEESLTAARSDESDPQERDGFARTWDGDTVYVFILRDGTTLLGALALSCQDGSGGSRPFSLLQGLLRPALQVLSRELVNQYSIGDLRKDLTSRDGDLELLLDANAAAEDSDDNLDELLQSCVSHLGCAQGALLVPDKNIAVVRAAKEGGARANTDVVEKTQRHLLTWVQVQRRSLVLNKPPPNSPLGSLPFKILACPVRQRASGAAGDVVGLLMLFKPAASADFDMRQVHIVETMTRRIGYLLQNSYDPATGLLTRPAFEQRALKTLRESREGTQHCIAYADVDRLHAVNENYGMHVGDQVIALVAETIRINLPDTVTAARVAGDRFALFMPAHTPEAARPFLDSLCATIASVDFDHEGSKVSMSASFGVAAVPKTRLPLSHALAAAEIACKAAKEHGRACVAIHGEQLAANEPLPEPAPPIKAVPEVDEVESPTLEELAVLSTLTVGTPEAIEAPAVIVERAEDDPQMLGSLREAIANERFRMEAQPIVRPDHGAPARHFELLLRMIDPAGESVTPDKFFSTAERHRLATDIDRWVVQYTLEILSSAAPVLESLGAHFSINISGQSLGEDHFPDFLADKLREYALPPTLLSFEIGETAAVANIVRAETLIRRLQGMGHGIALDDFGRGLSSLTYLKSLPVSDLKIDGALVRDLVGSGRSQPVVSEIVQLAQTLHLKTSAKCVESEAILEAVGVIGVDYAQGFAIGRPRPLEIVLQELLKGAGGARTAGSARLGRLSV